MVARPAKHASFMVVASVVILTSLFSLKGLSSATGIFKIEEWTMLHGNNSTKSKMHKPEKKLNRYKRANFVLCRDCFWCTSQIRMEADVFDNCPACRGSELETMPICSDESFLFECSSRNINLAFRKDADNASK
jgi:hypothetical protein